MAAFFFAFALLLQGYAVQTHIHRATAEITAKITAGFEKAPQGHSGKPAPAPDDCPFCQAAAHSSAVFTVIPGFVLPVMAYFQPAAAGFRQVSRSLYRGHDKEQRGPPTL